MRQALALSVIVAAAALLSPAASGHNTPYLFPPHQVLVRQTALQYVLNNAFPAFAPITVKCWGLNTAPMQGGGTGFHHIRCATGLNIPDFIYHLDAHGKMFVTRSW